MKKQPPDLGWKSYLQKAPPKCENRIPFNVLNLFPKVPGTPKSIANWTPNGPRNCKLWEKWAPKKTTKNKPLKSHQLYQNGLKLGTPGATKVQQNCNFSQLFAPRARNGPGVVPGSKKGRPRRPKGAKRLPKGSKKSWKRHPKGFHKASKCN